MPVWAALQLRYFCSIARRAGPASSAPQSARVARLKTVSPSRRRNFLTSTWQGSYSQAAMYTVFRGRHHRAVRYSSRADEDPALCSRLGQMASMFQIKRQSSTHCAAKGAPWINVKVRAACHLPINPRLSGVTNTVTKRWRDGLAKPNPFSSSAGIGCAMTIVYEPPRCRTRRLQPTFRGTHLLPHNLRLKSQPHASRQGNSSRAPKTRPVRLILTVIQKHRSVPAPRACDHST